MTGLLDYFMFRQQQAQDAQNQQAMMAAMFTGTPQDSVNITPRVSAGPAQALMMPSPQGPMPGGGVSPAMPGQGAPMRPNVPIPATATQPGQGAGGDNPQLALRAAAGMYNGPAPPGDPKAMLSAMPPALAMQLMQSMLSSRIAPKAPVSVAEGSTLVGEGPDGKFTPVYSAPPKKPTFAEAPHTGINPATGKQDQFIIGNDGSQKWLSTAPGPKINFVNGQAVDENAVTPGTVIPPQEPKQNYNQPFNNDGTPNEAYQKYKLSEVGAEAAARYKATNGTGLGADGNAIGTLGSPTINAIAPGYSSAVVPGTGITQASIDQKAINYITAGTLPPQGRTGMAGTQNAAISNRMAEIAPNGNLAVNKTKLKSLSESLAQQQKYLDTTERALNTANDTFDALQEWMQKNNVNPSQFPDYNIFSNYLKSKGIDPGIAGGYNAQLATLRAEFSQVLAKGGVRSVETDKEAAKLIPEGLAPAQLAQVAERIRVDGDNVTRDARKQVTQITGQLNGTLTGQGAPEAAPSGGPPRIKNADDYAKLPPGPYIDPNGIARVKK